MKSEKNEQLLGRVMPKIEKDKGQGTYQILLVILVIIAIFALLLWILKNN